VNGIDTTQGWNRYGYVGNRPLSYVDPSGYTPAGLSLEGRWLVVWVDRSVAAPGGAVFLTDGDTRLLGTYPAVFGTLRSVLSGLTAQVERSQGQRGGDGSEAAGRDRHRIPCSAASEDSQADSAVLIQVGFTDIQIKDWTLPVVNHMFVTATDTASGATYASRSGPGSGPGGPGFGPLHNTAVSAPYANNVFPDYGSMNSVQTVGYLNTRFDDVRAYMDAFRDATNSPFNLYLGVTDNSNSYASRLLEGMGFDDFNPALPAPGSDGGRVLPDLKCVP